jgi:methylenetetrahydrofolate dehydrogenase (NADP+)/methenyltetrahydrofolate cyclohydrolase
LVMHILATFRKKTIVISANMHIKTTSKIKLTQLSCIICKIEFISTLEMCCGIGFDGRALAKQIEADLLHV